MSTPRQIVQHHLLASLQTILKKNQYHTDLVTAEEALGQLRDLNLSDCPALVLWEVADEPELSRGGAETIGGRYGNQFFRVVTYFLYSYLADPGSKEFDDAEEQFIADIVKCLIKNRQGADARFPEDIHFSFKTSNFERIENSRAICEFKLTVKYNFREGDL